MRPTWLHKAPVMGSFPFTEERRKVYNRTGSDTVVGSIYMFDTTQSAAETTSLLWDDPASIWRNIVPAGTAATDGTQTNKNNATVRDGFFCVAAQVAPDNAELEVIVVGRTDVLLLGVADTSYQYFTSFGPTTGQGYGTISVAATSKFLGWTLEVHNADALPAAFLTDAFFCGWGLWY